MSISVGDGESYPGQGLSISQLLYAAKKKLRVISLDGRCVWTATMLSKRLLKTHVLQDRDHDGPVRGEAKREDKYFDAHTVTNECHVPR
jgi:hypothetical protein